MGDKRLREINGCDCYEKEGAVCPLFFLKAPDVIELILTPGSNEWMFGVRAGESNE